MEAEKVAQLLGVPVSAVEANRVRGEQSRAKLETLLNSMPPEKVSKIAHFYTEQAEEQLTKSGSPLISFPDFSVEELHRIQKESLGAFDSTWEGLRPPFKSFMIDCNSLVEALRISEPDILPESIVFLDCTEEDSEEYNPTHVLVWKTKINVFFGYLFVKGIGIPSKASAIVCAMLTYINLFGAPAAEKVNRYCLSSRRRQKQCGSVPKKRFNLVNINISSRETYESSDESVSSGRILPRHMCRGHYRNQRVGKARAELRRIWVNAHWRGRNRAEVNLHTYQVQAT